MLRNYIKIALRHIKRHKAYSFINVTGLALGMACCILILFWVQDELNTDRFHDKIDSLYIVRNLTRFGSQIDRGVGSVPAFGPALKYEYPEIKNTARLSNGQSEFLFSTDKVKFIENLQMADPEIFELFTFPLISGSKKDLFSGPNVMVLSQSTAEKYFGQENPVGQTITLNNEFDFRIAGIMQDIPHNSTIRFNAWVPLEFGNILWRANYTKTWYNLAFRTFAEVDENFNLESFNPKISGRIKQSLPTSNTEPFLYPYKKAYLHIWGRIDQIRVFTIIAFLILITAGINFINLTTARAVRRSKEVGLRKVVGARRIQVARQFFGESILYTFISLFAAMIFVVFLMPFFRNLTGKPLYAGNLINLPMIAGVAGIALLAGLISGLYPAVFLSAFHPAAVLKGKGDSFRKGTEKTASKVLINQRFADIIDLDPVIGARISQGERSLQVMGVVKNFHFTPVYREIGPLLLYHNPEWQEYHYMFIRLNRGNIPATIAAIKQSAEKFNPEFPFAYTFIDQDYDRLYRTLEREMDIIRTFTILAILISCLGLFGLASFTAEQRTKEIGIRKVLGASASKIVIMLSKEYAKWVLIANMIAWPIAYYFMRTWISHYPYRININMTIFVAAAMLSLLIAQITFAFQAMKAAHSSPADSIRYE